MIQPNEIRLGNWVLDYKDNYSKIIGFKPYDHSVRCDEDEGCYILFDRLHKEEWDKGWVAENDDLHPIPLTEEVLLKCGFEIKKGRFGNNYKHEYLILYTTHSGAIGFVFESGIDVIVEIKSLHHLQNLFFALTGQELEYRAGELPFP